MRHYMRLLEVARSGGIHAVNNDLERRPGPYSPEMQAKFEGYFAEAMPFVLVGGAGSDVRHQQELDKDKDIIFDAPFKVFSIERLEDLPLALVTNEGGIPIGFWCIITVEMGPRDYFYFALIKALLPDGSENAYVIRMAGMSPIVNEAIKAINSSKLGLERTRQSVKLGTGKTKRLHRIRRVIYVSPKNKYETLESLTARNIDWTHRFVVRGHWRACDGRLGKNRAGEYCVSNFTWVTEHERGPEDKPLIKKVRVVDGQTSDVNENLTKSESNTDEKRKDKI